MTWIVDTNVISETRRPAPNAAVIQWFRDTASEAMFTTVVNLAELRFGVLSQSNPERANALQLWLDLTVRPLFDGRVFGADEPSLATWKLLARQAQRQGRTAPSADLLIAAIALTNHCAVVTRDAGPFASAGVPVFNPWTDERFHFG